MKLPEMNGLEVLGLVGAGECGRVFASKDDDGNRWAVKVFEGMAVNRGLVSRMVARLEEGGWPEGVAEVQSADFEGRPACWVLPLFAERKDGEEGEDGEEWLPDTLQERLGEHPGEGTWGVVREIGEALERMHRKRVAHGNLKPGNVFFDKAGRVQLADWTLGNMPGIGHLEFTDALLYQPPEQLVDPGGYFEEEGYGWDVHAFGVLAFRLLTGSFPRCAESFGGVAPVAGERKKVAIYVDASKMARNLLAQGDAVWPGEPGNALEAGFREWIERCLSLSRLERPASMMEVMRGFAEVEGRVAAEARREELLERGERAERQGKRVMFFAGMATAACVVLGGLWLLSRGQLDRERVEREREHGFLDKTAREAVVKMEEAVRARDEAEQEMEYEVAVGLARLEASRLIGDRLFAWAMEKGSRDLPALDGRELRLRRLERYFEDFLVRNAEVKALEDERARARLQLAEVSLAAGDAVAAERRLEEAIDGWTGGVLDADVKLRLGRNALLLALLKQEAGEEGAAGAFLRAREALEEVPRSEVDGQRLDQLMAILDFSEAKILAASGDDAGALEQLMGATKMLNELADERPESAVLRSELAGCYLSSATILEGMGKLGDARAVRSLAAGELVGLLSENPEDVGLKLELAGCYGAMAEAAVLSGDVSSAERVSGEAMKLLDAVLQRRPDSVVAATRKAAQLGLQAGLLLDGGKKEEALESFNEGIRLLERQGVGKVPMVDYRLALLWWQKGRMLGFSGEGEEELVFLGKARELLRDLEAAGEESGIRGEELQRSSAYLLGDLAHAYEISKQAAEAREVYREAILIWEGLVKTRPLSEEYVEGLEWIRQRAKGI